MNKGKGEVYFLSVDISLHQAVDKLQCLATGNLCGEGKKQKVQKSRVEK